LTPSAKDQQINTLVKPLMGVGVAIVLHCHTYRI
jgi:hypothetical protein